MREKGKLYTVGHDMAQLAHPLAPAAKLDENGKGFSLTLKQQGANHARVNPASFPHQKVAPDTLCFHHRHRPGSERLFKHAGHTCGRFIG